MYKQSMGIGCIIALHVRVLATFAPPIEGVWYLLLACGGVVERKAKRGRALGRLVSQEGMELDTVVSWLGWETTEER
jgi:hypothetical protein